jgi:hypothetical protein
MWNWNIRQNLFVRRAIGTTGQSTTSEYRPLTLPIVDAPSEVVKLSSTPLEFSRSQALLAVTPSGIIPLRDLDFETYCEECDGVQENHIRE